MPTVTNDVFFALASPVRRSLLELLAERPQTAGDLAAHFDMRRPSVSEHLRLLRQCGLVREERAGRNRIYGIDARPLAEVADWVHPFERFWRARLHDIADILDSDT
jgi:DNA-binding transcriptional ArsR family regulator